MVKGITKEMPKDNNPGEENLRRRGNMNRGIPDLVCQ